MPLKIRSSQYFDVNTNPSWGEEHFSKKRINNINFVQTNNCWWQTWEMEHAIDIVNELKEKYELANTITYGLSHGGMGAIQFADKLKATSCLSFSPAGIVYEDILLKEYRTQQARANGLIDINGPSIFNEQCNYFIFYPSDDEIDKEIAESVHSLTTEPATNIFLYKIKSKNHAFIFSLSILKLLNPIINYVQNNDTISMNDFYESIKDVNIDKITTEAPDTDSKLDSTKQTTNNLTSNIDVELDTIETAKIQKFKHLPNDMNELKELVFLLLSQKDILSSQLSDALKEQK